MFTSPLGARRGLAAGGIILALVLAACSGGGSPAPATGSPSPTGSPEPTTGPTVAPTTGLATVLLEVTSEGGFINPSASLAALPTVVVYTDGRVLMTGAPAASNPDPLLASVSIRDLGAAGADAIRAAIQAAGLDKPQTEDPGVSADSGTSVFLVTVDAGPVTSRFTAGGPGPGLPGGGGGPDRTAAFDLLSRLLDTTDGWGAAAPAETTYQPLGYRVFIAPIADAAGASTVAWPLTGSLADFGTPAVPDRGVAGLRSGVVLGGDAATLGPVLDATAAGTLVTSGGTAFQAWVRALLPHELGG